MKTKQFFCNARFGWMLLIGLMVIGSLFLRKDTVAKAKVKTVTITKTDQQTAKKVHKQLLRGKKFKLRVKGDTKNFHKKAEKLMDKVALCTEYRFDFYPIILSDISTSEAKGYTSCVVLPRDCREYIYGLKFAEQRHELFINHIDEAIPVFEEARDIAINNDWRTQAHLIDRFSLQWIAMKETIPAENIPMRLNEVIISMRDLSQYLHETKFYDLSEAMKVRIMLTIGSDLWCEPAMHYTLNGQYTTFKALYENKAYGRCADFASATCKICAVFHIGDCDYFRSAAERHAVARTKVKTLDGETRYSIISNGDLENYNNYIGYKSQLGDYRRPHKMDKKIKKIDAETQELRMPYMTISIIRTIPTEAEDINELTLMHYIYLPRSEW